MIEEIEIIQEIDIESMINQETIINIEKDQEIEKMTDILKNIIKNIEEEVFLHHHIALDQILNPQNKIKDLNLIQDLVVQVSVMPVDQDQ